MVLVLVCLYDWLCKIALPISEEALFSQPIKFASKRKSCFGFGFTQVSLMQFLWFWFYDSQVKTALNQTRCSVLALRILTENLDLMVTIVPYILPSKAVVTMVMMMMMMMVIVVILILLW